MDKWTTLASDEVIEQTTKALTENGVEVITVNSGEEAKQAALKLIPEGSEVLTMTSKTLEQTGIAQEINKSGKYDSVRNKLNSLNRETSGREMKQLGAAPQYSIGSVHAVTEDGKVIIASASGSQLPGYSYGSDHVIWIVSTKKIVKDLETGIKRIYVHVLPLESERARQAYGAPGSSVNKLLIFNKEVPNRLTLIFVKEQLGF